MRIGLGLNAGWWLLSAAASAAPAVNDNYENRTVLEGESITVSALFLDSTFESTPLQPLFLGIEPPAWPLLAHPPSRSGSLWWEWTAPRSGGVVLKLAPTPGTAEPLPQYTRAAFKILAMSGANHPQQGLLHPPPLGFGYADAWVERSLLSLPYSAIAYQVVKGERYVIYGFGDARDPAPVSVDLEMSGGPVVLQDPSDVEITEGDSGLLNVVAIGVPVPDALRYEHPLRYSWLHNGEPVVGASNYVLPLMFVSVEDAGDYRAVVTDAEGSVTSKVARVTVVGTEESPSLQILRERASDGGAGERPIWVVSGAPGRTYAIESSTNLVDWRWQPIEPLSSMPDEPLITRTVTVLSERPSHVRIRREPFRFATLGGSSPQLFLRARRVIPVDLRRWVAWEALQYAKEDFGRDMRAPGIVVDTVSSADVARRIPDVLRAELFDQTGINPCANTIVIGVIGGPPMWGCVPDDPRVWDPNSYHFTNPTGVWNPAR
jgi:hypothetical protein